MSKGMENFVNIDNVDHMFDEVHPYAIILSDNDDNFFSAIHNPDSPPKFVDISDDEIRGVFPNLILQQQQQQPKTLVVGKSLVYEDSIGNPPKTLYQNICLDWKNRMHN